MLCDSPFVKYRLCLKKSMSIILLDAAKAFDSVFLLSLAKKIFLFRPPKSSSQRNGEESLSESEL